MTVLASPPDSFSANPLFAGLRRDHLDALRATTTSRVCPAGEVVLAAGEVSAGIHLIESGAAEVLASTGPANRPVTVATLAEGQAFGELSALTGSPAISTVRTVAAATTVRTLSIKQIEQLPQSEVISNQILRNVIRVNQQRLSTTNLSYAQQLEQTLELLTLRNASARLLILVIVLMCITILTNHWLNQRQGVDIYSPAFAWAALITLVLPTLFIAWREKFPPAIFGLTTNNLGRDLAVSSGLTIGVLGLAASALWLFDYPLVERFRWDYIVTYGPTYAAHSALQEFMGRGVLLGMMLRIFDSSTWQRRQLSNVAVSMMFGLTHIHFGLLTVALMIVFSILIGSYFMIYRNLAGPVIIHTVLGLSAFMFGLI